MTNAAFLTLSHCEHLLKYTKRAVALTAAAASAAAHFCCLAGRTSQTHYGRAVGSLHNTRQLRFA